MAQDSAHILVVEDDPDTRRILERFLKLEKYRVGLAATCEEAWKSLESDDCPDLVLLDLSLPDMDGAEFMQQIKGHAKCSRVKVSVVSGWDKLAQRAQAMGAHGYVRKPVDLVSLQTEVKRLLKS